MLFGRLILQTPVWRCSGYPDEKGCDKMEDGGMKFRKSAHAIRPPNTPDSCLEMQRLSRREGIWSRGFCVSSIGLNEKGILAYVEHQEKKIKGNCN
jgi:hypothetical protein